ncbi:MAG: HAMP domain-containing histidine kinase [Leadbetterella sp.]|nr:HAMP domain-containing histidine kinase [Leadbetterella sp.]
MNSLFTRYKAIAIVSLVVLFFTQCYMTYHTYAWKDHDYHGLIKPLLGSRYLSDLQGDILYPGGEKILVDFMNRNYSTLEKLYWRDSTAFGMYAQRAMDSLFHELRQKSTLDNFMQELFRQYSLDSSVIYRVSIQDVGLKFTDRDVPLFSKDGANPLISGEILSSTGAVIDGSLENCTQANRFTTILVDSQEKCNCYIRFSLWIDSPHRTKEILRSLLPILLLSLTSITLMVLLFFLTFRNWARQKKLADLKQDFVNNITHELNTPLTTIIVANRNLQNEDIGRSREYVVSLAQIIERNALWLKSLFSRVLQSEAMSKTSLNKEPHPLSGLLAELIQDYTLMLANNDKIRISLFKFGEETEIWLDKFWFTSMMNNLIENGIKYNTNELIQLDISVFYEESGVRLEAKDNGIGMTRSVQQQIFDKFYRKKRREAGRAGSGSLLCQAVC